MGSFSDIDVLISDVYASGFTDSRIVDLIVQEYQINREYAQSIVETYLHDINSKEVYPDFQNDFESNFEIEYDF
jgi:hypothetical protein